VVHVSSIDAGMGVGDFVGPAPQGLGMSRPGPLVVGQTVIDIGLHRAIISELRGSGDVRKDQCRAIRDPVDTQLTQVP
jgi:hypothetical protein